MQLQCDCPKLYKMKRSRCYSATWQSVCHAFVCNDAMLLDRQQLADISVAQWHGHGAIPQNCRTRRKGGYLAFCFESHSLMRKLQHCAQYTRRDAYIQPLLACCMMCQDGLKIDCTYRLSCYIQRGERLLRHCVCSSSLPVTHLPPVQVR